MLDNAKITLRNRDDATFQDRGKNTMADEVILLNIKLDSDEFLNVINLFWEDKKTTERLLHRASFLLSFGLMCRGFLRLKKGDNIRSLKVSCIGLKYYPDEGVNGCYFLRVAWRKSKNNQFGYVQQGGLVRY